MTIYMLGANSCQNSSHYPTDTAETHSTMTTYDSTKARLYGADDYGMKKYVMAFLKKGPNRELPGDLSQGFGQQ